MRWQPKSPLQAPYRLRPPALLPLHGRDILRTCSKKGTLRTGMVHLRQSSDAMYSVHVAIREQLSLTLNQSGGLKSFGLKGDLNLLISDASYNKIKLTLPELADDYGADLQFKYHPNLFKGGEAEQGRLESEVRLKDEKRSWPVGQPLGVLRWKLGGKDESFVPLSSKFLLLFVASNEGA